MMIMMDEQMVGISFEDNMELRILVRRLLAVLSC
jgi:hypothetical protein